MPPFDDELTAERRFNATEKLRTIRTLVVFADGGVVEHALPERGAVVVGRSRECEVVIPHASVSRRHARLDLDAGIVTDLGARNGTSVGGVLLDARGDHPWRAGEPILLGDVTIMVTRSDVPPAVEDHRDGPPSEAPLEPRLVEEAARAARDGAPFIHARIHVAPTHADHARDVLTDGLRASDVLAEDGRGRFQLLLPGLDVERGRAVIDRLVSTLAVAQLPARAGVAACPHDGITAAQLSARARELVAAPPRHEATAMDEVRHLTHSVAAGALTVLITGETGVGKELFAEIVHRLSPRARRPFVRINCAAISETLLESELFGHARGAFTGADVARVGLIETADGGTLFLDEIGEMALRLQASLLRVLEERAVRRVGESDARPVDVRIIAATNRSLLDEVEARRFRRDLYYRLSGVTLAVPPLRERPDEIEAIARAFAALAATRTQTTPTFSAAALAAIRHHPWPGNIRELKNAIERAVLLAAGRPIQPAELGLVPPRTPVAVTADVTATLPPISRAAFDRGELSSEIADLERRRILEALEACGGNQTRAARALGLSRNTLLARLDTYGLRRPRKGDTQG